MEASGHSGESQVGLMEKRIECLEDKLERYKRRYEKYKSKLARVETRGEIPVLVVNALCQIKELAQQETPKVGELVVPAPSLEVNSGTGSGLEAKGMAVRTIQTWCPICRCPANDLQKHEESAEHLANLKAKTPCVNFQKGHCYFGSGCHFLHSMNDPRLNVVASKSETKPTMKGRHTKVSPDGSRWKSRSRSPRPILRSRSRSPIPIPRSRSGSPRPIPRIPARRLSFRAPSPENRRKRPNLSRSPSPDIRKRYKDSNNLPDLRLSLSPLPYNSRSSPDSRHNSSNNLPDLRLSLSPPHSRRCSESNRYSNSLPDLRLSLSPPPRPNPSLESSSKPRSSTMPRCNHYSPSRGVNGYLYNRSSSSRACASDYF